MFFWSEFPTWNLCQNAISVCPCSTVGKLADSDSTYNEPPRHKPVQSILKLRLDHKKSIRQLRLTVNFPLFTRKNSSKNLNHWGFGERSPQWHHFRGLGPDMLPANSLGEAPIHLALMRSQIFKLSRQGQQSEGCSYAGVHAVSLNSSVFWFREAKSLHFTQMLELKNLRRICHQHVETKLWCSM